MTTPRGENIIIGRVKKFDPVFQKNKAVLAVQTCSGQKKVLVPVDYYRSTYHSLLQVMILLVLLFRFVLIF